jgi:hypothetical protein
VRSGAINYFVTGVLVFVYYSFRLHLVYSSYSVRPRPIPHMMHDNLDSGLSVLVMMFTVHGVGKY